MTTLAIKTYTTEQLKAIDAEQYGDTGASQEPGIYWQENDEDGELETGPCGPFETAEAARADYNKLINRK